METITEDYVSFEIAKLLKEKGFNKVKCLISTHFAYNMDGQFSGPSWDTKYNAPTLQMTMKWLREKHNIVVEPFIREDTKYVWYIRRIETIFNKKYLVFCWGSKNEKYERYEEACEAAIKYCLENLI